MQQKYVYYKNAFNEKSNNTSFAS